MAYWPIPLCTSFAYLGIIFLLTKVVMPNRPAMKLFELQVIHNFIMTTVSSVVFVAMTYHLFMVSYVCHHTSRMFRSSSSPSSSEMRPLSLSLSQRLSRAHSQ